MSTIQQKSIIAFVFLLIISLFWGSAYIEYERAVSEQKKDVMEKLQVLSAQVNQLVTQTKENGMGLIAYVKTFPDLSQEEFSLYAHRIYNPEQSVIRHYTVLKDTTIAYVYPYEDNKDAIGVDLGKIEAQREDILKIKNERISMFVGPVNLIQGGRALINRMPIVIDDVYWGQMSLVIRYDKLMESSGIEAFAEEHYIAIEQVQGEYITDKIFYSNVESFSEDVVFDQFDVPNGKWVLSVEPKSGYSGTTPIFYLLITLGILFSVIVSKFTSIILVSNERLNRTVAMRTKQITETNHKLKQSLNQLKETQEQLINREYMASLSSIVAGISHEINTPLGVCITGASMLNDMIKEIRVTFDNQKMSKEAMVQYLDTGQEASDMILDNLNKVNSLVLKFKDLALDEKSEKRRYFHLSAYVKDICSSLINQGHKKYIKCHIAIPEDLELDSYPGLYYQLFSHLVTNSLTHGFSPETPGNIWIEAVPEGEQLTITYRDDGRGLKDEEKQRLFEPFFTTKLGKGGSGLGMNIVYNIVNQSLHGRIEVGTPDTEGTEFLIQVPLYLPTS